MSTYSKNSKKASMANNALTKFVGDFKYLHEVILLAGVCIIAALLLGSFAKRSLPEYKIGDIARETIKSDENYTIIDEERTSLLQEEAVRSVAPIVEFDKDAESQVIGKIDAVFKALDSLKDGKIKLDEATIANLNSRVDAQLSSKLMAKIVAIRDRKLAAQFLKSYSTELYRQKLIVASRKSIPWNPNFQIEIQGFNQTQTTPRLAFIKDVFDLEAYKLDLKTELNSALDSDSVAEQPLKRHVKTLSALLDKLVIPNLKYSATMTSKQQQLAAAAIDPVKLTLQKGETIIRDGDRVSSHHLLLLNAMNKQGTGSLTIMHFVGRLLILSILLTTVLFFGLRFLNDFKPSLKDYYLMACLLIGSLLVIKTGFFVIESISVTFPNVSPMTFHYVLPFAAAAMILRMVYQRESVLLFSVVLSVLVSVFFDFNYLIGIYTLLSSLFGSFLISTCQTRTGLFRCAFYVGLFNGLVVIIFSFLAQGSTALETLVYSAPVITFASTVTLFTVLSLSVPIVEHFDYLTDMKLIELANFNHPLLHRLAIEAPGTYHHSRVVAQLVEAAASSIGANPLLAMVSALYHDIGKTKAPQYFVENQNAETRNAHDKLKPSMSKMIIVSHIKDGIEMAKRAGLPTEIVNGIPEHHGTSLIAFFYQKAKDQEDPDLDQIEENEYRYPGPKPRTKETALLLLADSVEATTKSLPDATPEKIQGVIQKIFNKYFTDGQLDDCDLTLSDLNKIAKSFHRTLTSVYKPRVEYPEINSSSVNQGKAKKQDAGRNNQSTKASQNKNKEGEDDDGEDLKRLGL